MIPKSAITDVSWPAVPSPSGAVLLAMQQQLQETEWLAAAELERLQLEELARLLRHACNTVPYYRDGDDYASLAGSERLTAADWARLPVLTRNDVQQAGDALRSEQVPTDHQPLSDSFTAGTTGPPVRTTGSLVTGLFWMAVTLREQLWHGRDLGGTLAAIRAEHSDEMPAAGVTLGGWGPALDTVYDTGPCQLFSLRNDIATQAEWLRRQNPDCLITYPSNAFALARHFLATGARLPRLREVSTFGEALTPDIRSACEEAWDAKMVDMYSTQEVGYIALQCPRGEQYHVQAENVYVEVLDEDGEPCKPGQVGSVVVSSLHNYAMPLLRYGIGDYAEVGEPCACGRSLPVLARIMGRERNMMVLPSGQRVWPTFPPTAWGHIEAIQELQIAQVEPDRLDVRIVGPRPLAKKEKSEVSDMLRTRLGYPFRVSFSYIDAINRGPGLKSEDFVSEIAG